MTTLYNVCSVHLGMSSTSGGVQYIGDTMSTSGDIMSTSRDVQYTSGGYHEYIRGYHEYRGACSVHWGIPCVHRGMFSTSGDFSTVRDVQYIGVFNRN